MAYIVISQGTLLSQNEIFSGYFNQVTVFPPISLTMCLVAIIYAAKYALMQYLKLCIQSYFCNVCNFITVFFIWYVFLNAVILSIVLILMDYKGN